MVTVTVGSNDLVEMLEVIMFYANGGIDDGKMANDFISKDPTFEPIIHIPEE